MFRGRFQLTIDPKGRLSIPAKFRDVLRNDFEGKVIVVPHTADACLEVHPLAEWERKEEDFRARQLLDSEKRKASRLYFSRAKDALLDGAGRILIPPDVREQAGLSRDVMIVAGGERFFEVWDRARLQEFEVNNRHELQAVLDRVSGGGTT